jgi:hypothetical protein
MAENEDPAGHVAPEDIAEEALAAVRDYITRDFASIDAVLRRLPEAELKELDVRIRLAHYGLFRLPSFRGVVYRGADLSQEALDQYIPGTIVFEPAFVSTTANPARRFPGNTTFVIASINGRDVSPLADDPEEREVVFFTGTWFKVLATEHDAAADDWYIYLAEIPDTTLLQEDAEG